MYIGFDVRLEGNMHQ
jgi:hypothetical protein